MAQAAQHLRDVSLHSLDSLTEEAAAERKRLAHAAEQVWSESYGCGSHAKFADNEDDSGGYAITDYTPDKLSTIRVFCVVKGTVLTNIVLFFEQLLITSVFAIAAVTVYNLFQDKVEMETDNPREAHSLNHWLMRQEPKMRQFAAIMTTLAAFLLTFYTTMSVNRWWTIRTQGVGGIKAATVALVWTVHQICPQDSDVLDAISRYGRASLKLIFIWRRSEKITPETLQPLEEKKLLTAEEVKCLLEWNHCLHETIWAWQMGIVRMMQSEGRIPNDQMLRKLIQYVEAGRQAVQVVHTHVAVKIPMQYVHLLGLLVKMHNFVLALIMGILFGAAYRGGEWLICAQLFGRTLILPFLFNAILLINAELSDPFDGGISDFPDGGYLGNLGKDCQGILDASQKLPSWIADRKEKSKV
jgi:hypothetical protein